MRDADVSASEEYQYAADDITRCVQRALKGATILGRFLILKRSLHIRVYVSLKLPSRLIIILTSLYILERYLLRLGITQISFHSLSPEDINI